MGDDLPGVPGVRMEVLLSRDGRGRRGAGLGAVPGVRGWRRLPLKGERAGFSVEQSEAVIGDHVSGRYYSRVCSQGEGEAESMCAASSRRYGCRITPIEVATIRIEAIHGERTKQPRMM